MPAVVTARNTPITHNNSATGPFGETGMCCGYYVTFVIWVLVLAALSLRK